MLIRIVACSVLALGFGVPYAEAALPGIVISGRVINTSTGKVISGVTVATCTANNPITDANGHWQALVPSGTIYCVRIGGGIPAGLTGQTAINNNPDVSPASTYENQQAGVNCYHNSGCSADLQKWDRSYDGSLDFTFRNAPAPVKTPTPVRTPTPAPPVAPVVTPVPDPTPTPTPTSNPSETPVATNSPLPTKSPSPSATPEPAKVGFTSDDKIATAELPVSGVPAGTSCVVKKTDPPQTNNNRQVVAGAYELICTNSTGGSFGLNAQSASWKIHLKGLMDNLGSPTAMGNFDGSTRFIPSSYDKATNILSFSTSAMVPVYAIASPRNNSWIGIILVGGGIALLIAFVLFFPMRVHRRRSYQEYLRAKYYDL